MFKVAIKSETCGWQDYDNCDRTIADISSDNIPRVGEIFNIHNKLGDKNYLVTEIKRIYLIPDEFSQYKFEEWTYVYVVDIS